VAIDVTVTNGPGLDGVYVLDIENYIKLRSQFKTTNTTTHNNNNNSSSSVTTSKHDTSTLFNYFVNPSCVADTYRITWCNDGDSSDMGKEISPTILSKANRICIALSNVNVTSAVTVILRAQLELVHPISSMNDTATIQKSTAPSSYGASYQLPNMVSIFHLSLFTIIWLIYISF
jgi:hypothetical protein